MINDFEKATIRETEKAVLMNSKRWVCNGVCEEMEMWLPKSVIEGYVVKNWFVERNYPGTLMITF